jgi:hypothetical protein
MSVEGRSPVDDFIRQIDTFLAQDGSVIITCNVQMGWVQYLDNFIMSTEHLPLKFSFSYRVTNGTFIGRSS